MLAIPTQYNFDSFERFMDICDFQIIIFFLLKTK